MCQVWKIYILFASGTDFNHCLSSWADETPPDVNVGSIFASSGCRNKNAKAKIVPGVKVKMSNAWRLAMHQQAPIAKEKEKSNKKNKHTYR